MRPLALHPIDPAPAVNVLTVDVEDYFHASAFAPVAPRDQWPQFESRVVRNTDRLLEMFARAGARATFFVLGWVAQREAALVRRIAEAGHELASHSYWHRLVYDLTPAEFRQDLRQARDVIEQAAGVPVRVHAFLDGRDTAPRGAEGYLEAFEAAIAGGGDITIASLCGRYFAMDRDKRWERVARAYTLLTEGEGNAAGDAAEGLAAAYAAGQSDEFVEPVAIAGFAGMRDGDGLLMGNFRADRAREILTALLDPAFDGFPRPRRVAFAAQAGMVSYSDALDSFLPALFQPQALANTLGDVVSQAGLKQLRIAETEKYAHVTFFLNGGEERVFEGEERILVPSPRVATYDLQPEMAAGEVTDRLVAAIASGAHDLIVVNYANPDMVGHTGILPAAIRAVETIDACLGRLAEALEAAGGAMLVTADHGNIEMMADPATTDPHTAHTINPVPALLFNGPAGAGLRDGRLADIAPTLLGLLGLPVPAEMTGRSLLAPADGAVTDSAPADGAVASDGADTQRMAG